MQVNSINNNSQPSFKAYISNDFYVATEKYFQKLVSLLEWTNLKNKWIELHLWVI